MLSHGLLCFLLGEVPGQRRGSIRLLILLSCRGVAGCELLAMPLQRGSSRINDCRLCLDVRTQKRSA